MEAARERRKEIAATNVLFGGLAFSVVVSLLEAPGLFHKPTTLGMLLLGYLVFAGFYYAIRVGISVFKWLFLLGVAVNLVYSFFYYHQTLRGIGTGFLPVTNYVVFFGSRLVAAAILLRPQVT
jgi:hypothetical protein